MEITKPVKLKNCILIGEFENILIETNPILENCYVISKDSIDSIEGRLQGVKIIKTKPIY